MNKQFFKLGTLLLSAILVVLVPSCKEDDPSLPDNLVTFETTEVGLTDDVSEIEIQINVSRAVSSATELTISFAADGVVYGEDFTTDPAATENAFSVTLPANETSTSFKVIREEGVPLDGTESVVFTLSQVESGVVIGETHEIKVSFASIVSGGSQLQLNGLIGTETRDATTGALTVGPYNSVYVDFSGNTQTPVDRRSWNLAFYNGSDFKVILNPNLQTTAAPLTKTDIATVTLADADAVLNLNHNISDPATLALVDYYDGDLSKLVFADVSATDADNKVYLVSFEGNKAKDTWYKVKVSRNGTGYRIQYALIGETTIKTLDVAKDANYNFSFVSLVTGNAVSVEPTKSNWDIAWGYSTYMSVATNPNSAPYWYQDFLLLNYAGGAQAAEIVVEGGGAAATAYTNFSASGIAGLTFVQTRDAIGSKWRTTTGTGIKPDRFYVVKDPAGNVYKLKFITMGVGDEGERGRPVIEYKLVKAAD